jgi:hypothetical protein
MTQEPPEGEGFSSDEEVIGTLDLNGPPPAASPGWWTGRRTVAAVGVAAALAAGGYGIAVATGGRGAAPTVAAAGAAPAGLAENSSATARGPGGCGTVVVQRGLAGTLKSDNGSSLTVQTPGSATRTVKTSASTTVVRIAAGSLADVSNGDQVLVFGAYTNGDIQARQITVGNAFGETAKPLPPGAGFLQGFGVARGTVADKSAAGFTVVAADGSKVSVTTSSSTTVATAAKITVGALQIGHRVAAAGTVDTAGTISATSVEQLDTNDGPVPRLGFGIGGGGLAPFGFGQRTAHSGAPSDGPNGDLRLMVPAQPGGGSGPWGYGRFDGHCGAKSPMGAPAASAAPESGTVS